MSPDPEETTRSTTGGTTGGSAARPYSIAVGVLLLGIAIFAGVNSLNHKVPGLEPGDRLPKFAAPSAAGTVDKDANVDPKRACTVRVQDAIRICDYFDRPIVIVAWFKRGCGACRPQLDRVEQLRRRFPGVHFLGLDIRDSLANARKEVRRHGWRFPMALDRDGAVSRLYGIGGGPTIFFAYPKGILMRQYRGELSEPELAARVRALEAASRKRSPSTGAAPE